MTLSRVYFAVECCRDSFNLACKWFEANKPRPLSLVLLLKWNCICGRVGIVNKYLRLSFSSGWRWKKEKIALNGRAKRDEFTLCNCFCHLIYFIKKRNGFFYLDEFEICEDIFLLLFCVFLILTEGVAQKRRNCEPFLVKVLMKKLFVKKFSKRIKNKEIFFFRSNCIWDDHDCHDCVLNSKQTICTSCKNFPISKVVEWNEKHEEFLYLPVDLHNDSEREERGSWDNVNA